MLNYTLLLHGHLALDSGLPGPLLRDLLDAVDDSTRGAVRLRLEGRSQAKGGFPPAWVNQAAAFDMVGFTKQLRLASSLLDYLIYCKLETL